MLVDYFALKEKKETYKSKEIEAYHLSVKTGLIRASFRNSYATKSGGFINSFKKYKVARNLYSWKGVLYLTELGNMTHSSELLKGTLQTILLKILKDHGRTYGYEITQRVRELSDGSILLTEGALYPTLHRLEAEGLLKTEKLMIGKRVRKYYMLTAEGKSEVKERVNELVEFMKTMTQVLQVELA